MNPMMNPIANTILNPIMNPNIYGNRSRRSYSNRKNSFDRYSNF